MKRLTSILLSSALIISLGGGVVQASGLSANPEGMISVESTIPYATKEKLLRSTGFFEGDYGFSSTTGNYDGAGLSFGIIQFNFGSNTLQPLLKEYITNYRSEFVSVFGSTKAAELENVVLTKTLSEQIAWGQSITDPNNAYLLKPEWDAPFKAMGAKTNNQNLQRKYAEEYMNQAEYYAREFNMISTQGLAFLFDQAVHEWSWSAGVSTIKAQINYYESEWQMMFPGQRLPDDQRCAILLDYVRTADGEVRRTIIKEGTGVNRNKQYRASDFGLSYTDRW